MSGKILVIDDDDLIRVAIRNVVGKAGFTIFEARNGDEGLALFTREQPDLVITDILMPDKEGIETIREMRAADPSVKILAISGGGTMQNMTFLELARKLGADSTLGKPFRPDDLLDAVKSVLAA